MCTTFMFSSSTYLFRLLIPPFLFYIYISVCMLVLLMCPYCASFPCSSTSVPISSLNSLVANHMVRQAVRVVSCSLQSVRLGEQCLWLAALLCLLSRLVLQSPAADRIRRMYVWTTVLLSAWWCIVNSLFTATWNTINDWSRLSLDWRWETDNSVPLSVRICRPNRVIFTPNHLRIYHVHVCLWVYVFCVQLYTGHIHICFFMYIYIY